jgi:hypothetical protein
MREVAKVVEAFCFIEGSSFTKKDFDREVAERIDQSLYPASPNGTSKGEPVARDSFDTISSIDLLYSNLTKIS